MRAPRLLLLGLLAVLVCLAAPASAASPLKASPTHGPQGKPVTLTYTLPASGYSCGGGQPPYYDHVDFFFDDAQQPFATEALSQSCTATATFTQTGGLPCGGYTFGARFTDANGGAHPEWSGSASYTVTCAQPTKSPTPSPKPSPTRSRRASPTPSPTASPTATATPTPTPTATVTPSATAAAGLPTPSPTRTALPVATPPSDLPSGGSSSAPWVLGGVVLGVAGLGASFGLLRPRGAGTPVLAGVSLLSVLAGTAVALKPVTDPVTPLVLGTYAVQGAACAGNDIPISGGFHVLDVPPVLLHHEPNAYGLAAWDASASGTSESSTVCLRLSSKAPWTAHRTILSGNPPHGAVSCQTTEQLLGGGFYVPWGLSGRQGSHPEAPARWAAVVGPEPSDLPPISATVSALCAQLPEGVKTYTVLGSTAVTGTATARCYPGDVVLNGGHAGGEVRGSHPVDGGWQAELGFGGGTAYALCVHPSRILGIRSTYVRQAAVSHDYQASAACDASGQLLGGGWTTGGGIGGLQHFRPDGNSWVAALPDRGDVTSYALCARRY